MGETHYEEFDIALAPVDFRPPAPPLHLSAFDTATQYGFCRFPVGWVSSWHPTPKRQVLGILSGALETQTSDGDVGSFGAGNCFLLEDTTGQGHVPRRSMRNVTRVE